MSYPEHLQVDGTTGWKMYFEVDMRIFQVIVSETKKTIHIVEAEVMAEAYVSAMQAHNDGHGVSMGTEIHSSPLG